MKRALFLASLASVVVTGMIVFTLFREAWTFTSDLIHTTGLGALLDRGVKPGWYPRDGRFDLLVIGAGAIGAATAWAAKAGPAEVVTWTCFAPSRIVTRAGSPSSRTPAVKTSPSV